MSVFIIGDVQGCATSAQALVQGLPLSAKDELWLCGDLVNRGPDSVGTLRWLSRYPGRLRCVLGNHDLAVLAQARQAVNKCGHTARQLLAAEDGEVLLDWLQNLPLMVEDHGLIMVHAGLPPCWDLEQARMATQAVERSLRGSDAQQFLGQMYGDQPTQWSADLPLAERQRYTVNALTRMRYVHADGALELTRKDGPDASEDGLLPWFAHPQRRLRDRPIAFGHWSTLGHSWWPEHNVWGLDSGCVWGGQLTALQWPERRLFHLRCPQQQAPGVN